MYLCTRLSVDATDAQINRGFAAASLVPNTCTWSDIQSGVYSSPLLLLTFPPPRPQKICHTIPTCPNGHAPLRRVKRGHESPAPVREPALASRRMCAQERRAGRGVRFILRVALIPLVCARIGRRSSGSRRKRVKGGKGVQRGPRRVVVVLCAEDLVQPQRDGVARLRLRRRRCPCVGVPG
jgi:hypothetical protein